MCSQNKHVSLRIYVTLIDLFSGMYSSYILNTQDESQPMHAVIWPFWDGFILDSFYCYDYVGKK